MYFEEVGHFHGMGFARPIQVVPGKIYDHYILGLLLRGSTEVGAMFCVFFGGLSTGGGSFNRLSQQSPLMVLEKAFGRGRQYVYFLKPYKS